MQKFQRGNLVKFTRGHIIWKNNGDGTATEVDLAPERKNKLGIILGSYRDLYGGGVTGEKDYSVILQDTGNSIAWIKEEDMLFIQEGGEELITKAKEIAENRDKKYTNLSYIVKSWEKIREKMSSITAVYLLKKIAYPSRFESTGEFFLLQREIFSVMWLLDLLMREKTIETILSKPELVQVPQMWDMIKDFHAEIQLAKT